MPNWLTKILATGFGTGYAPIAGTIGTIPAWIVAWFLLGTNQVALVAAAVVMLFLSVYVATQAERIFGHDSKSIVIDEWAGMWVTVIFLPHTLTAYIIAFFAFRLFDVIKLPPAAQAEKLPRGWGITMDDVFAGIQANLTTHLILYIMAKF
jgi:phosphatidylglycerophosphatase A